MNLIERSPYGPILPLQPSTPCVSIVEDDICLRESLALLISNEGWTVRSFASAQEFLSHAGDSVPTCLILDLWLPDMSALDLQLAIEPAKRPPIIFLSRYTHIPSSVCAIKAGALDFLIKPVDEQRLLGLLKIGLNQDRERRAKLAERERLQRRFESLTPREREVLPLVVEGFRNKQSAAHLGISAITFQIHRTNVMRKMNARSLAALVRMAIALEISMTL